MEYAVETNKLSVRFSDGFAALDDVTVTLPKGKITGCIGPSGAGKTTFIRALVGRQHITSGTATVLGLPAGSRQLRGRVRYMTQELSVYGDLTITENLHYFGTMLGLERRDLNGAVHAALAAVDLTKQANRLVGTLSGGQKQRVSLAVALLGPADLLVLDEPTVGLDPLLREQLWQLFHELAAKGRTILLSSHVMDEAERCDELLLIRDGRLLARGTPAELQTHTESRSVEESFIKLVEGTTA